MDQFFKEHSGEITILVLCVLLMATLLTLIPQLLRARQHYQEMEHAEHMRALEQGQPVPHYDERSLFAGRTAVLVPIVAVISAAVVTCFLAGYKPDSVFSISLVAWIVAGVVGLTAITGGVALMGRLASMDARDEDDDAPSNPWKNENRTA